MVVGLYLLGNLASVYIFHPVQAALFPQLTELVSLLFLPHGVRVLATIVLGAKAIPGLAIATVVALIYLYDCRDIQLLILIPLISGCVPWIVLRCLRFFGTNAFYLNADEGLPAFATLLKAGIVCSLANSFLTTSLLESAGDITNITLTMAAYAVGDITGLIASWLLANAVLKWCSNRK